MGRWTVTTMMTNRLVWAETRMLMTTRMTKMMRMMRMTMERTKNKEQLKHCPVRDCDCSRCMFLFAALLSTNILVNNITDVITNINSRSNNSIQLLNIEPSDAQNELLTSPPFLSPCTASNPTNIIYIFPPYPSGRGEGACKPSNQPTNAATAGSCVFSTAWSNFFQ